MRAGIDCNSVRRPLEPTKVSLWRESANAKVVATNTGPQHSADPHDDDNG